jgi:hypothetical protein
MTRSTRLVTACALTGALLASAGAVIAACGARPGSPGELPPMAPRPGAADPTATPGLGARGPAALRADAGVPLSPGPVSVRPAAVVPMPEFSPVVGVALDGYSPPLPPIPDSSVPADSRLEPRVGD